MEVQVAQRLQEVQEYFFSKKLQEINKLETAGMSVINLGIGNPEQTPSSDSIHELVQKAQQGNVHGYQSYKGIPALREAFSNWYKKYYQVNLNPESEILPLHGSKEGIMFLSMAYLNEGDEVLVPNPGYPTYASASKLMGAKPISYKLNSKNNWLPNFEELEKQDLTKVKLMWLNYPHMPSGAKGNREVFEKAIAFGLKHKIIICHDNPYSFILNEKPLSILHVEHAKEISVELNSLSKSHNMAGWRMGFLSGNREIVKQVLRVKSNMDSGMFLPLQNAAIKALEADSSWYENLNKQYKIRREYAFQLLNKLRCEYEMDQTGMFVWARIPDYYKNAEELSDLLLKKTGIFITPGNVFGSEGNSYVRVSLCASIEKFHDAINRVYRFF